MDEEIDRIERWIRQIEEDYPQAYVIESDGRIPQSKNRTKEISQEYECLKARLQELNEQADKDKGIK